MTKTTSVFVSVCACECVCVCMFVCMDIGYEFVCACLNMLGERGAGAGGSR